MSERRKLERVLVVEDDERILRASARALHGRLVCGARTLAEARAALGTMTFDAAFIDVRVGSESGLDLIPEVRAGSPAAVIVVYSGWLHVRLCEQAMRAGADHLEDKATSFQEVLARLEAPAAVGATRSTAPVTAPVPARSLDRVAWDHVQRVLHDSGGNVSLTARRLGLHRTVLQRRLKREAPRE